MSEVDRVDILAVDERLDLDRPGLARLDRGELLVGQHDLVAVFELEAATDLLPFDLFPLLGAVTALLDRGAVLLVELAEVKVEVARRARQAHRHVDQAEGERSVPERARHAQDPFFRLALRALMRSDVSSSGSGSSASISSPFALRAISSRTASR